MLGDLALESTQQEIRDKKIGDSMLVRMLSTLKKLTFDAASQLRIVGSVTATIANNQDIRNVTGTVTRANVSIWDSGTWGTWNILTSQAFQSWGRRLIRKV